MRIAIGSEAQSPPDRPVLMQREDLTNIPDYPLHPGFRIVSYTPGDEWLRIHWVAIAPAYQGRGLAKPLVAAACLRLRALGHVWAYLTTSTSRLPAVSLYTKFGIRSKENVVASR